MSPTTATTTPRRRGQPCLYRSPAKPRPYSLPLHLQALLNKNYQRLGARSASHLLALLASEGLQSRGLNDASL
jgi:hypothetical protein